MSDLIVSPKSERNVRDENQDVFAHFETAYGSLFILADGMGGASSGFQAADTAVSRFPAYLERASERALSATEALNFAVRGVNTEVYRLGREGNKRMGTTLVALLETAKGFYLTHLGDSRAYHILADDILRLTTDHSAVQVWMDQGRITEKEAREHPRRGLLTRAIGVTEEAEPDLFPSAITLEPGEGLLLCSDGLSGFVEDHQIFDAIRAQKDKRTVAEVLVRMALDHESDDNITVLYIHRPGVARSRHHGSVTPPPSKSKLPRREPKPVAAEPKKIDRKQFLVILGFVLVGIALTLFNFGLFREDEAAEERVEILADSGDTLAGIATEIDKVSAYPWEQKSCPSTLAEKARQMIGSFDQSLRESMVISPEEASERGEVYMAEVASRYPNKIDLDASSIIYMHKLADRIMPHLKRTDITYTFHVVDDEEENAFAIPGGHIYIFKGLLDRLDSEAQLFFVLAHEMHHIDARHLLALDNLLRSVYPDTSSDTGKLLSYFMNAPFSLAREKECDAFAVRVCIDEGYSPYRAVALMNRFQLEQGVTRNQGFDLFRNLEDLVNTHPAFDSRSCAMHNQTVRLVRPLEHESFYVGTTNLKKRIPASEQTW